MRHVRRRPIGAGIARDSALCATAAAGVLVVAAVTVSLAGLADEARRMLRFGFGGVDRTPTEAARIAIHNARFAGGTLVCAALAPRLTLLTRRLVDLVLAALLSINAAAVGVAVGAYGTRAISATALHVPLEFGALSIAGGAYMQACKRPLRGRALAAVAAVSAVLLLGAAALETYASLVRAR